METFFQTLASGIVIGSVYSLVGMGIVVIYKSTKVFNFAQGGLVMLGAFLAWSLMKKAGIPVWLALISGVGVAFLIGVLIEVLTMRRLVGQPIISLIIVTLAIQAFINGVVILFWGESSLYAFPPLVPEKSLVFLGINMSLQHSLVFAVSIGLMIILLYFFKHMQWGLDLRAVAEDHETAMCMGISTRMVFTLAWSLSCILAYAAGVLLGIIHGVSTSLYEIGTSVFPVVLLGGLESIPGVVVAGLIVGVIEFMSGQYIDRFVAGSTREIVPYIILLLVLVIKPYGLFGLKRIERV
jgi:branched-chain amino acid transport system permease protein